MSKFKAICGGCGGAFWWNGSPVPKNAVCWECFQRNTQELNKR